MTPTKQKSWWESQLPDLNRELHRYLKKRLPTLRGDHDDLVNETLLSITQEFGRRSSGFPSTWFGASEPSEADRAHLHRLAIAVLRRRIADFFRNEVPKWNEGVTERDLSGLAAFAAPEAERGMMLAGALRIALAVLANSSKEDRDLLGFLSIGGEGYRRALSARERHRLRRLRERLRAEIVSQLGASVKEILRNDH